MLSETAAVAFYPELFTLPRNGSERNSGSLLLFLLHGTEFRAVFSSTERFGREFREFALPQNDSERNSESLLLFLLHGTEFRVVFFSAEGFGTEFREFLFRGTVGIPSEITICSVNSVFRGIIFLSEIPNPNLTCGEDTNKM
jgi:hypothetical protein